MKIYVKIVWFKKKIIKGLPQLCSSRCQLASNMLMGKSEKGSNTFPHCYERFFPSPCQLPPQDAAVDDDGKGGWLPTDVVVDGLVFQRGRRPWRLLRRAVVWCPLNTMLHCGWDCWGGLCCWAGRRVTFPELGMVGNAAAAGWRGRRWWQVLNLGQLGSLH